MHHGSHTWELGLGVVRHHWRDDENADRPLVVELAGYIVVGFGD